MEKIFQNKTVIVTGGAFGIGRATALAFAERGANVAVVDIVNDSETLNLIKSVGGSAIYLQCDVSKANEVKAMVEATVEKFGRLDFAFNNAGIEGATAPTADCTEENWDRVLAVNLKGPWLCMKYEIPYMLQQKTSAIVNCSSVAGLVGFQGIPAYVASKHGLAGLTKAAALEYAKTGLRVNAVSPGVIKTPMIDRFTGNQKQVEQQFISMEPIGRLGEPSEVANAVVWLCSDAASFVTGHVMPVDGGWVAQ